MDLAGDFELLKHLKEQSHNFNIIAHCLSFNSSIIMSTPLYVYGHCALNCVYTLLYRMKTLPAIYKSQEYPRLAGVVRICTAQKSGTMGNVFG